MNLQKHISESIAVSTITPQSRLYRTGVSKTTVWETYLSLADTLNSSDEGAQHWNCSTCRSFINTIGAAVYYDVKRDVEGKVTGEVYLRSLLWEPSTVGMSPEIIAAFAEMRAVVIGAGKVKSVMDTADIMDYGVDEKGGFNHLHIKGLILGTVSPQSVLHPSHIEQRVGQLKRVRSEYTNLDAIVKEHKYMLANADIPSNITDKIAALISYLTRVAVPEHTHDVYWLTASNPALVEVCKFHNTPVGQYLSGVLDGKDEVRLRKVMMEQYRGDKYMQTTNREIDSAAVETKMIKADTLLNELGLNESLPVDIVDRNFEDMPVKYAMSKPPVPEAPLGLMAAAVSSTKEPVQRRVVKVDPSTQTDFVALLPKLAELSVNINVRTSELSFMARQTNREVKSIRRDGEYYSIFGYHNATVDHYTNFRGYATVDNILEVNGFLTFNLADNVIPRENTLQSPLFPETLVPEVHSIRDSIVRWCQVTKVHVTPTTQLTWRLYENAYSIQPTFRYVLKDDLDVIFEVTVTAK